MSLQENIDKDLVEARKAGEGLKREVLGMVKAALTNFKIAQKKAELSDDDVITVLGKEVKSRRDAAAEFEKVGSSDRAKQEQEEAQLLAAYLPEQMSDDDIEKKVAEVLEKLGVTDQKQMGQVMGALSRELKGKADLKKVNEIVRKKLSGN